MKVVEHLEETYDQAVLAEPFHIEREAGRLRAVTDVELLFELVREIVVSELELHEEMIRPEYWGRRHDVGEDAVRHLQEEVEQYCIEHVQASPITNVGVEIMRRMIMGKDPRPSFAGPFK